MTAPKPHREEPIPDSWKNESLRYLMGELSPTETAYFEANLEQQPELAQELANQAEMITALAESPVESNLLSATPHAENRRPAATVAALVALAVCLAALVIGIWPTSDEQVASTNGVDPIVAAMETDRTSGDSNITDLDSEALLIARAWAEDRTTESLVVGIVDEAEAGDDTNGSLAEFTAAGDDEMDSTLSWMYIAVSSNMEEASDG
jgi:hypothetical protein